MKTRTAMVGAALTLFLASGCGYALVGRGRIRPAGAETILVPTFINQTTRVGLEQRVTQAVATELVGRGGFKLVNSQDATQLIMRGWITSFGITPVAFNSQGRATDYQASITAKIELVDHRAEDAVVWKNDHYRLFQTYPIDLESTDAFDQETRAVDEMASRFAQSLVTSLVEGF